MKIISYATKGNYEKELNMRLLPSLKKFNLSYDIEIISETNWQKATHYKAEFIKKMLNKHKQDVVFLDVDAEIRKFPDLFYKLKDYDLGVHYLDWHLQWRKSPGDKIEALSGTLYINYNQKVFKFMDKWIAYNKICQKWEQKNMQKILEDMKDELKIYKLPYSYITIILHNNAIPEHMIKEGDVVILHHQASRKFKK